MDYLEFIQSNARNWQPTRRRKSKKGHPERLIMKEIYRYLLENDFLVIQINSSVLTSPDTHIPIRSYVILNDGTTSGISDLVAIKDGKITFIEVKAPHGQQRPTQKRFEQLCKKFNTDYIIARSLEDVKKYFEKKQ